MVSDLLGGILVVIVVGRWSLVNGVVIAKPTVLCGRLTLFLSIFPSSENTVGARHVK